MKKLTWALLSLMLFLGMGTAFADDPLPAPVLPSGNAIPANSIFEIGIPDDVLSAYGNCMIAVLYTFDNETAVLEADMDIIGQAMDANGATEEGYSVAAYYAMEWTVSPMSPDKADGQTTKLRARIAIVTPYCMGAMSAEGKAGDGFIYSEEASATYTVGGEAVVVTVIAPTLSPAGGAVEQGGKVSFEVEESYEDSPLYPIYYVYNNSDFDFSAIKSMDDIDDDVMHMDMNGWVAITEATTITVAIAKLNTDGSIAAWSDPVTGIYTIAGSEPVAPEAPVFNPNGGVVTLDQQISLTTSTGDALLYYTMDAEMVPDFSAITTEEDLEEAIGVFMPYDDDDKITLEAFGITEEDLEEGDVVMTLKAAAAVIDGEGNITWSTTTNATFTVKGNVPAGAVAQPVITPDMKDGVIKLNQKVTIECATEGASIYYTLDGSDPDATKTLYEAPFLLPENTPVDEEITIKAIAIKDGVSSPVRISVLMVEEAGEGPDDPVTPPAPAEKPEAPKFEVDGKAVTAPALAVEAEKVEVKWIGEASEDYVVVYTLDGSEAVFDATSMEDEVLEDALYWSFGDEAIDVTVPATIKARVAAATNAGDITWSDMTTLDLMAPVPAPTFEPASGTTVDYGAELTLSCANEDAWILYTLDGSEPSTDNDKAYYYGDYSKPGITAKTIKAVAMVKGVYSEVVTAT
ncbi:MAG: chitobiase/beta-hexosaminidase C-terminal domain-containing protein, partial [Bacteroidales bacterium]|nr:chitobiase/beta-hexosaminidase C-terminal domain-containing protein [Bacteroidales bacterium]